jgi:hypothetical protein
VTATTASWIATLNGDAVHAAATNTPDFASNGRSALLGAAPGNFFNGFAPGAHFKGDVAEVIIYDHALTSPEREAVFFYLNQRYAFSESSFSDQGSFSYDSDGDGLSNTEEQTLGTNPYNRDTDGDGLPDDWEIAHGLDPLNPADAALDADSDGYTNLAEYLDGTDPNIPVANDGAASVHLKIFQPSQR